MIDESQIRQQLENMLREDFRVPDVVDWVISLTRTVAANAMETMREAAIDLCSDWANSVSDSFIDQAMAVQQRATEIRNLLLPTELTDHIAAQRAEAALAEHALVCEECSPFCPCRRATELRLILSLREHEARSE